MSIHVKKMALGIMRTNTYITYNDRKIGFIVDPAFERENIMDYIIQNQIDIRMILITHGHFDHVYEVNEIKNQLKEVMGHEIEVVIHENGKEVLEDTDQNLIEIYTGTKKQINVDRYVRDNTLLHCEDIEIRTILVGGHTIDSCCYYVDYNDEKILFSGDTLFRETIGRTDLKNSNYEQELKNIREKLFALPKETKVYPGHGKDTLIEHEKSNNMIVIN